MIGIEFNNPAMAKSPTLNVIISEKDKERLKQLAVVEKRSMSQLASIAIQEYLDRYDGSGLINSKEDAA
jgi:CopG-like RHH_1 or ribbon-helix-helix domain, RHH_5